MRHTECLNRVLGIEGACDNAALSAYMGFVNTIPGLSLDIAAMLSGASTNNNSVELVSKMLTQAHEQVNADLRKYLREVGEYDVWESLVNGRLGFVKSGYRPQPAVWTGVDLCPVIEQGGMGAVQLNAVTAWFDGAGPVNFVVLSGQKRYDYETESVAVAGGFAATIRPLDLYADFPVAVLVAGDGLQIQNTAWGPPNCDTCTECANGGVRSKGFILYSASANEDDLSDLQRVGTATGGLELDVTLTCDVWQLHCRLASRLVGVTRWATGLRLVQWALFARERQNYVTISTETLKQQADWYKEQYASEFDQIAQALRTYLRNEKDPCLTCRGRKTVAYI